MSRSPWAWLGLLVTLALAIGLFAQFSIDDRLSRDDAIFTYGAQQLVHGVPYYKSIFDAKGPIAPMVGAIGVEATKLFGGNDVHGVRVVFFVFACLAAAGVYLLALSLWRSVAAGLVSAVVFLSFKGFALDATGGPDAKTPGIAFAVFAMLLLVRRRFFWGGVLGALAFLCWQPLGAYIIAAIVAAFAMSPAGRRLRSTLLAALGAAIPIAASFVYFWLAGALSEFTDAAFGFPLLGVQRGQQTLSQRLGLINDVIHAQYNVLHGWLLYVGLALMAAAVALVLWRGRRRLRRAVADPLVCVVALSGLPLVAFTLHDFQGYPDVYPLLAYSALGVGSFAALAQDRAARAAPLALIAACAVLAGLTWSTYARSTPGAVSLKVQEQRAAAIEQILGPTGRLYAIGDPTSLVLTHRRNPSRYIYLGSGVLRWMLRRTPGGYNGWLARIRAADPGVIVIHTFLPTKRKDFAFLNHLQQGYIPRWLGAWELLIKPELLARAREQGVVTGALPPAGYSVLSRPDLQSQ